MQWLIDELSNDPANVGYRDHAQNYADILDAMTASTPAVYADEEAPTIERTITTPVPITFDDITAALTDTEYVALPQIRTTDVTRAAVDAVPSQRAALQASGIPAWVLTNDDLGEDPALYDVVRRMLEAGKTDTLAALIGLLAGSGLLSPETAQALGALMQRVDETTVEEPDPEWTPTVVSERVPSRIEALGEGRSTQKQIRRAVVEIGDWPR